jgi:polysaccharide biosynthesis protein PslG
MLVLGALVAAASTQAVPRQFFGVQPQGPLTTQDYERMGEAKVGLLRFELHWAGIDRTPSPGDLDWSGPDEIVRQAARNRVSTLPFIYSTPAWVARDLDGRHCADAKCLPFAPKSKAARNAWAAFIGEAVKRYGPDGTFWVENPDLPKRPIRAWQLWNEQNSPTFYRPKPTPRAFVKLLGSGAKAIREADRGGEVIMGGMFGTPLGGRKPGIAAWNFLEKLYRVKGAKRTFDAVAPHPYAAHFRKKVLPQVKLFRDEMKDGGDRKAEMWITEIGWGSDGAASPLNRGPEGQAKRLKESFKYFKNHRKRFNIETVNWYSWRDNSADEAGLCKWCNFSGLLKENFEPKPSLRAFTKFTGGR